MPALHLRAGTTHVELAPEVGGSITRFSDIDEDGRVTDWLRPAARADVEQRVSTAMSCFPLVPFSNRIANARFTFGGRRVDLVPNFPPEPHAIHGTGWQSSWDVIEDGRGTATLAYTHEADAWPWPFHARQVFRVTPAQLDIRMSVVNSGTAAMPLGVGWHPFFVRTPQMRIRAAVSGVWTENDDNLPVTLEAVPADWGLADGLNPDEIELDDNFTGWSGSLHVEWPDRDARLSLTTEGPFSVLVIYTPAGAGFACAEPATNVIDAFNLAAAGRTDTGMVALQPGQEFTGAVRFRTQVGS